MLNVSSGYSQSPDAGAAAAELEQQLRMGELKLVVFFAAHTYDFVSLSKEMHERFPGTEIIGCTTAGEISKRGFTEKSVAAIGIASDHFTLASMVVKDIHSIPMMHRKEAAATFRKAGFDPKDPASCKKGFGILLIDGLRGAEEKVLSVLNSIIDGPDFQFVGGSAGDGLEFKNTYVCLNGVAYTDAAVVTFIKTDKKFYIHKEDIFATTEKSMTVTKANVRERRVYELNNRPAAQVYAEQLNVPKHELSKRFAANPLGRRIGDKIWTASPFQIMEDDSIVFYSQIFPGALVDILHPVDVIEKARNTVQAVQERIPKVKAVIAVNCILRTLQFKEQNQCGAISSEFGKLEHFIGFSSYGEQMGKMHLNQTLVLLALGE